MEKHAALYNTMNDTDLWDFLLEGKQEVLEELYKRHYALLLNYGLKYDPDQELVKDCIHDIFVRLYQSRRVAATTSPRAYLLRSLRNRIIDRLAMKKEVVSLDECMFRIPENSDLFERSFARSDEDMQLYRRLFRAMSHLSSSQRQVLYLRYVRELSYKEIAEVLEINVQSSMNLVSRTLAKIRLLIGNDPYVFLAFCQLFRLFFGK